MRTFAAGCTLLALLIGTSGGSRALAGDDAAVRTKTAETADASVTDKAGARAESPETLASMVEEIQQLKQLLQEQASQYSEQQKRLAAVESELEALHGGVATPTAPAIAVSAANAPPSVPADQQTANETKDNESPLFFRIGRANFTPGGFLELTTVVRSKDVGSGIGTTFGTIPYAVAASYPAAGLSETRFSAQNSRMSLKVDSQVGSAKMFGYLETDFLGNNATTMEVTSNSATLRLRLAFVDATIGKWEILGGQGWSLLTPSRKGLSPMTSDVFYSMDGDTNYQLGIPWARQPQLRVVYHLNSSWTLGLSAENPQQFIGSALTVPTNFVSTQADTNGASWGANTNTPNMLPDFIAKIAFDTKLGHRAMHMEAAGVDSTFKVNTFVAATSTTAQINVNSTGSGAGASFNTNLELFKNFHLIENAFWSDGGGRYLLGLAPDFVVRPANAAGVYTISPIHADSWLGGFEWQVVPRVTLYGYYSGLYVDRDYFSVAPNGSCGASGYCGYGFPGSANTNNRALQESTFGVTRTMWNSPALGKLAINLTTSYLTRNPWSVASGTPREANLIMGYAALRYVLP